MEPGCVWMEVVWMDAHNLGRHARSVFIPFSPFTFTVKNPVLSFQGRLCVCVYYLFIFFFRLACSIHSLWFFVCDKSYDVVSLF